MSLRFTAFVVVLSLAILSSPVAEARDRPIEPVQVDKGKMRAYNIGLTSVFTLLSAVAQGQVQSPRDAVRHLLIGSAAGYGFYQAKRIAGDGRTTEGWLLANATSSIVENTSSGEHPIGRFGYTVGPFRLRVATPFARKAIAHVELDWSVAETGYLYRALDEGDHVQSRDGLIAMDRDSLWRDPDREDSFFEGRAWGVFPGVAPGARKTTWPHEVVHVIQSQQLDSVEPPVYTFGRDRDPSGPRRLFALRHIRLGVTHAMNNFTYERPYQERWGEVEATGLAEKTPVPH